MSFARPLARVAFAAAFAAVDAPANPLPDHFGFDPSFNGGVALDDRFASGQDTPHFAERILQLPNGEVVVAGLAALASQTGNFVPGNIGLVHYGANGERIAWSNPPGSYASYFNIYITFPNVETSLFKHVADIEYFDGHIFVLADWEVSSGNRDVYVIVLNPDGSFVGSYNAFGTGLYEFGAALVPYSYTIFVNGIPTTQRRLIAVANYNSGTVIYNNQAIEHWVITRKSFTMDASGALAVDNGFGHVGNGAIDQPLPLGFCEDGTVNACSGAAADAFGVRTNSGSPTLYLLGNLAKTTPGNFDGTTDAFVMAIDGGSGDLYTDFGSGGIYDQSLLISGPLFGYANDNDPAKHLFAFGGAAPSDDLVYFVAEDRLTDGCEFDGAGVYKLRARVGPPFNATLPDFNWGSGGKARLAAARTCGLDADARVRRDFVPHGMAVDGTRIGVSGTTSRHGNVLGTVRLNDGAVISYDRYQWLRPNGTNWENSDGGGGLDGGYHDIAATGDGRWTVTGTICDQTASVACALYGTVRLASDEIFGNGYD
jgi:hypothetical protein